MVNDRERIKRVLVSPSSFGQCGEEPLTILEKEGFDPVVNPYGRKLKQHETINLGTGCIGIVAGVETINRDVLDALDGLKCISRVGVGMDKIDLDYARQKGILVCNTPDGPKQAVAELTLGLAFNLLRKISIADRNIRAGIWKKEIGFLLSGKKIGVFGLGRIGRSVALLFESLGNEIFATDVNPDRSWLERHRVKMVEIETLFSECDLISIHLPGNPSGNPIVDSKLLQMMKSTSFLINVARGGIV
jgi:D-3-phosphoglycerate dehydrogenase